MRLPYSVQGLLFAPALLVLVFFLRLTCPVSTNEACFSDYFSVPAFMPLAFAEKVMRVTMGSMFYEIAFVMIYWTLIGFLVGLCFDVYKKRT